MPEPTTPGESPSPSPPPSPRPAPLPPVPRPRPPPPSPPPPRPPPPQSKPVNGLIAVPPRPAATAITPAPPALDVSFPPTARPSPPITLRQVQPGCFLSADVKAFGAKGDGFSGDAAELAAADAAPGTILYFPPGTYRIATSLTLAKAVVMGEWGGGVCGWVGG